MKARVVLGGVAAALAIGSAAFATNAAASSDDAPEPVVSVHKADGVNGVEIAHAVAQIRTDDRGQFTQDAVKAAFDHDGGDYNVIIQNLAQGYDAKLDHVRFYASVRYGAVNYGLWISEKGDFTNIGDGGYINWAFHGWFDREDKTVHFHRP